MSLLLGCRVPAPTATGPPPLQLLGTAGCSSDFVIESLAAAAEGFKPGPTQLGGAGAIPGCFGCGEPRL